MNRKLVYGATAWNFAGNLLPLLVGLYAIPQLIRGMGETRFGLLTLLWALIGYFGIFDLGLGRAVTQAVAEASGRKRDDDVPGIFWTSTCVLSLVGLVGMVAVFAARPILMNYLSMPSSLQHEFRAALGWIAVGVPFVTLASASRGLLEGDRRFAALNMIRVPYGALTFALPLLFPISMKDLALLAAQLVALRILLAAVQYAVSARRLRGGPGLVSKPVLLRLLRFGGWMTLASVVSPVMNYMDRFVIGVLVSVSVVAFYTTPHEIVMRLLIIPGALAMTLFPVFGQGLVEDRVAAERLYRRASDALMLVLFVMCATLSAFGNDVLVLWLGRDFAQQAKWVLVVLTAGVWFNGTAYLPYTMLLSSGNSRAISLTHVAECLVYIPLLAFLVSKFGIIGAAAAWAIRAWLDLFALDMQATRFLSGTMHWKWPISRLALGGALVALASVPWIWARAVLLLVGVSCASMVLLRAAVLRLRLATSPEL